MVILHDLSFNITSSTFTNNSAVYGGVTFTSYSSLNLNITNSYCTFSNNSAAGSGGVACIDEASSFNIIGSSFYANKANSYGGIIVSTESSTHTRYY